MDSPPTLTGAQGLRCPRHVWGLAKVWYEPDGTETFRVATCVRCGKPRDDRLARKGRSSRRLGADQERRAERRYGWAKIGERGEATDLRGRFAKVQQKSTRRAPPQMWRDVFAALDATRDGRVPLLLLSFVSVGRPTQDYVVMTGETWLELHGVDAPE